MSVGYKSEENSLGKVCSSFVDESKMLVVELGLDDFEGEEEIEEISYKIKQG